MTIFGARALGLKSYVSMDDEEEHEEETESSDEGHVERLGPETFFILGLLSMSGIIVPLILSAYFYIAGYA